MGLAPALARSAAARLRLLPAEAAPGGCMRARMAVSAASFLMLTVVKLMLTGWRGTGRGRLLGQVIIRLCQLRPAKAAWLGVNYLLNNGSMMSVVESLDLESSPQAIWATSTSPRTRQAWGRGDETDNREIRVQEQKNDVQNQGDSMNSSSSAACAAAGCMMPTPADSPFSHKALMVGCLRHLT